MTSNADLQTSLKKLIDALERLKDANIEQQKNQIARLRLLMESEELKQYINGKSKRTLH